MLVSCEDILDQQVPAHSTVDGNVILDEATAEVALVGVYSYLSSREWEWYYSRSYGHLAGTTRGSGSSSGTEEAGFEGAQIFNTMQSDEYGFLSTWSAAYKMINGANTMIKLTNNVPDGNFSEGRKESIIAEATFLRFFAHFHIFRLYGYFWDMDSPYGALYRTEPSGLSNHVQARLSVSETYDQLIEDLDYVIEFGPEVTDVFHVNRYTAMAFKTKVLAMRGASGDYAQVISLVDQLMAEAPYSLHADYYSYFFNKKTSSETIFGRHFASNMTSDEIGITRARWSGYYRPTDMLKNLCSSSVQYAKAIQDTLPGWDYDDEIIVTSYDVLSKIANHGSSEAEYVSNAAFTYLRLAELIVLKAEALARTTGTAVQVCDLLNPLLTRAMDTPLDPVDYSTQAELLDVVYEVLLKEMCCESGLDFEASLRFLDGTGLPKLVEQKEGLFSEADLSRAIMPIPIEELNINVALEQNPGYDLN